MGISLESSRRDVVVDMIVDTFIFKNYQITLSYCFTFISKTGMRLSKTELVLTVTFRSPRLMLLPVTATENRHQALRHQCGMAIGTLHGCHHTLRNLTNGRTIDFLP